MGALGTGLCRVERSEAANGAVRIGSGLAATDGGVPPIRARRVESAAGTEASESELRFTCISLRNLR